jgi:NDP-sugar pyrophosphorylase family protein
MPGLTRQACILVGGRGVRLGALTQDAPKPLMPFGLDRVFLDFVIEQAIAQGFDDILLLAGYLGDVIQERYQTRAFAAADIRVVIESSPAGTGGALYNIRDLLAPRLLVLNGDSLIRTDMRAMSTLAEMEDRAAMMALRRVVDPSRYGAVELSHGQVTRFREKSAEIKGPALINAGVYVFRANDLLEFLQAPPCSLEIDILPKLAAKGALWGFEADGYFIDIGLPESLASARKDLGP